LSIDVLAEVRSDEYPLRKGVVTNLFPGELEITNEMSSYIDSKVVKVPDTCGPTWDCTHGVVDDQWIVLAHVVSISVGLIRVIV
jgi:hypothetical protein